MLEAFQVQLSFSVSSQVLGYVIDCQGNCEGQCNRCWVRL